MSPAEDRSRRHSIGRWHEIGILDCPEFDVDGDAVLQVADRLDRVIGDDLLAVKNLIAALDLADHLVTVDGLVFIGFGSNMQSNRNRHWKVLLF
jgi:hypothetical protein